MMTTDVLPDAQAIDRETRLRPDRSHSQDGSAATARGPADVVAGQAASLTGEIDSLRRSRLAAASVVLTVVFGALFVSNVLSWASELREVWLLMGARFALAAVVMVLLYRPWSLSKPRVRLLEAALFGGLTASVFASQYTVNLVLMRRGDMVGVVSSAKNGVIQTFALMVLYGTFIPNKPKTVAKVVAGMVLAPVLAVALLGLRPEVGHVYAEFRAIEHNNSNAVYLAFGAGVAVYGAVILNKLRTELHAAKRYGQYQLVRKLGEGGMGEVYLAEHQLLKRPCALKMINAASSADPMASVRFEREVQSAAKLAHPNTIAIFDYGRTDDGTFYYVMEYLEGLSLAELVREAGPLPPGRAIYLFRQLCAGLAEAHKFGLVHRDLKPGNAFVAVRGGEADVAKVLDFGLVKITRDPVADAHPTDLTLAGTPQFMAPEQARCDRSLDHRADIYALGAMLYHALTGRPPFLGKGAFAQRMAHALETVECPSRVRPGLPPDLVAIVLRCLAKRPDDRFPNVNSLNEALASCVAAPEWGPNRAEAWWAVRGMPGAALTPASVSQKREYATFGC